MKRIYFEMIAALIIFAWTISNIIFNNILIGKEDNIFVLLPIISNFVIQFIGVLIMAASTGD